MDYLARVFLLPCLGGCFARRVARRHSLGFERVELLRDIRKSTRTARMLMRCPVAHRLPGPQPPMQGDYDIDHLSHSLTHTLSLPLSCSLSISLSHTHPPSPSLSHTHALSLSLSLYLSPSLVLSLTDTHTHVHTFTHTHINTRTQTHTGKDGNVSLTL